MTDPLQQALIDLERERQYAAQQTGLLIQARNELSALKAINAERAKVIAEQEIEIARLTECVKALEAESLPDEAQEAEWQRVTKGGKR